MKLIAIALLLSFCITRDVFALLRTGDSRALATKSLKGWLGQENRCLLGPTQDSASVRLVDEKGAGVLVEATRDIVPGEILFRLGQDALWSAHDAYSDRDLGGKLRDLFDRAGPGFDIVALSGALAAERIRKFQVRRFQGLAPESAGKLVPSKFGSFARWIWTQQHNIEDQVIEDPDVANIVNMGVNLLVPLLDVAARRSWTAIDENLEGTPECWSRSDLEALARSSFALTMGLTKSPPPYLLDGIGTLVPDPFVSEAAVPDKWPGRGEDKALVPLLDSVIVGESSKANSVIGSPPAKQKTTDSIWCVATQSINAGEPVISCDPWIPCN